MKKRNVVEVKRPKPSPAGGYRRGLRVSEEINILKRDILRVRLKREKLRLEKEKFFDGLAKS